MFLLRQPIIKQLYHNILAILCGGVMWYIVSEKVIITQIKEIPIFLYNTHTIQETFACPSTAFITIELSPSSFFASSMHNMGVHLDMSIFGKNSTVLTDYQAAIVLPKGIKIVHCNPIIIHKIEKNTVT